LKPSLPSAFSAAPKAWAALRVAALGAAWGLCSWLLLLAGLGSFGVLGPDEPRYAAIAQGMLRRHDLITPKLWGTPWLEKPVLYYWLAAASQALTHLTDAAARRPNALLAVLMSAALTGFLWRVHSRRAGILAAFMSVSSVFWLSFGRAATTDMTLTAPLALSLMALYAWWQSRRPRWLAVAAVLLALATLAKGPVAVGLAGLILLGFAATQGHGQWRRAWTSLRPLPMALFVIVAAPWYVAVSLRNPGFLRAFFWQQNLERFATNRYEHPQAFWFYVPVLLLAVFPWTGWLELPLAAAVRRVRGRGWRRAWQGEDAPLKFFLGCWALAPLIFFSLSRSKLPSYILPAIPAVIALMAVCASERWPRLPRWPLAISALLTALVPAALRLTPWLVADRGLRPPVTPLLAEAGVWVPAAVTAAALLWLAWRRRPAVVMTVMVAVMAAAAWALTRPPLSTAVDAGLSGRPLARALQAQCGASLPGACQGVPLYAWNLKRDLLYGTQFYLGGVLPVWPPRESAPSAAYIVLQRAQVPVFVARYGGAYALAQISRLQPVHTGGTLVPWIVIRAVPLAPQ